MLLNNKTVLWWHMPKNIWKVIIYPFIVFIFKFSRVIIMIKIDMQKSTTISLKEKCFCFFSIFGNLQLFNL